MNLKLSPHDGNKFHQLKLYNRKAPEILTLLTLANFKNFPYRLLDRNCSGRPILARNVHFLHPN